MQRFHGSPRFPADSQHRSASSLKTVTKWTCSLVGVLGSATIIVLLAYVGAQSIASQPTIAILCFVSLVPILATGALLATSHRRESSSADDQRPLAYLSLFLLTMALACTLAAGIMSITLSENQDAFSHEQQLGGALIALALFTSLAHFISLSMIIFRQRSSTEVEYMATASLPEISIIGRPATAKTETTIRSNPFSTDSGTTSPRLSLSAISFRTFPSRSNSKSRSRPSSNQSNSSQFDFHWDTSSVPHALRDAVHRTVSTKLPPIPGSRPVSPAKALDGPFLPPSPHPNQSQPSSPAEVAFPRSSIEREATESIGLLPPQPPFAFSASSKRSSSPSPSSKSNVSMSSSRVSLVDSVSHLASRSENEGEEAHIHPLFRSKSPEPAPYASKRTIVTAASVIDAEVLVSSNNNRSRAPSRTYSRPTSPLMHETEWTTPTFETIETTVFPEADVDQTDIIILPSLPRSSTASRARTSTISSQTSPPSSPNRSGFSIETQTVTEKATTSINNGREIPLSEGPIPSFIVAAGARNSLLDFAARLEQKDETSEKQAGLSPPTNEMSNG